MAGAPMLIAAPALLAWLALVVIGVVGFLVVARRRRSTGVPLAHTDSLRSLPRYAVLARRQRRVSLGLAVAVALVALSAFLLTARPASSRTEPGRQDNRDIMLCLDVSTSMEDLDAALLTKFQGLVDGLHGQRIGLMIFDAAAVLKFPLTDDYDFAREQLQTGVQAIRTRDTVWPAGTLGANGSSSLIGDGVVSCLGAFDHPDQKRARSIVLATDGEPGTGAAYTVPQAAQPVAAKGVRVYTLSRVDPQHQDSSYRDTTWPDLQTLSRVTRGALYYAGDTAAVPDIVTRVLAQQASSLKIPPKHVHTDRPAPFVLVAVLGSVALVVAAWRGHR